MKIYSYKNLFYAMYMFLLVTFTINSDRSVGTFVVALIFLTSMFKGLKIALVENAYSNYQKSIATLKLSKKFFSSRFPEIAHMSYYIIFGTGYLLAALFPGSETAILGLTISIGLITVIF